MWEVLINFVIPIVLRAFHTMLVYITKGTIKSCQKFLIKHNKQKLRNMMESTKNPGKLLGSIHAVNIELQ